MAYAYWSQNDASTWFDTTLSNSREGAIAPALTNLQGMQAFQVVSQTNQGPLATCLAQTAQGKLAEAQHFLDDANPQDY